MDEFHLIFRPDPIRVSASPYLVEEIIPISKLAQRQSLFLTLFPAAPPMDFSSNIY